MTNARRLERRGPKSDQTDPLADAVRYLARGDRSEAQVARHLAGRGSSKAASRSALRVLKRLGYVNDVAVALRVAQARLGRRVMARAMLAAELESRGFSAASIAQAVLGAYDGVADEAVAARFLASLPIRYQEPERERARRAGLLRGRGFSFEVSEAVLGRRGDCVTYADGE